VDEEIPKTDQQIEAETKLTELVADLKDRKRINGTPRDIEELIDPEEERVVGAEESLFTGNDSEIVAKVMQESIAPIEKGCVFHEAEGGLELASMLRRYRFDLQRVVSKKQTTLGAFFVPKE
jgi:hypothetical protein